MSIQHLEITTGITVRYAETDQMGIAHHSNYPIWFEESRTNFFKKIGYKYSYIESKGILLPLTGMSCKFIKPAKYEENLIIKTMISRLTHVRVGFHYEIFNKDNEKIVAIGETNHGWTDRDLNPVAIKKLIPDLFQALQNHCSHNQYD